MSADKNEALRRSSAMREAALVVMLERAGGRASYSEADYQAVAAKYGGPSNLAIHVDVVKHDEGPSTVELRLIRKTPANAELVS